MNYSSIKNSIEYVHEWWTESMRPAHGSTDLHKITIVDSLIYSSDLMRLTRWTAQVSPKRYSGGAARPHGGAMAERGCSLEYRFSRVMVVGFRWGLLLRDHNDEGNSFMLTLVGGGRQWGLAMVRWLSWLQVSMGMNSGCGSG
jgi:hypothetical protein